MHSYILTGLRMGPLVKLLRREGFTPSPRNIGRLVFIMHNAFWASFFSWREKKKYGEKVQSWPMPEDPIIIIGHWRTGSTLLHLMMARDGQFVAPTLFQAAFPDCFLSADRFYRPVMGRMVNKRPMDNVKQKFDDAQEDEFALLKLTTDSPLLDLVFPKNEKYFINHYDDFNPSLENYPAWKEKLGGFCKKITRDTGRILMLKNPAHSLRIPFLLDVFPKARFIHIHRHPYQVVPSSQHLWKTLISENILKGKPVYPKVAEVTEGLKKFYDVIDRDLEDIPLDRKSQVAYEDIIADPVASIKKIYVELGLRFTEEFEKAILSFQEENKDFRKKSYTFGDNDKEKVFLEMKTIFERFHY